MLQVEPTDQRGCTTTLSSSRNGLNLEELRYQYVENEDRAMVTVKQECKCKQSFVLRLLEYM